MEELKLAQRIVGEQPISGRLYGVESYPSAKSSCTNRQNTSRLPQDDASLEVGSGGAEGAQPIELIEISDASFSSPFTERSPTVPA